MSQYVNKIRTNSGDLQIDYNALANLPTISNSNLLINSDFRKPINQRGQTTYAPTDNNVYYTIDRWCIYPSYNSAGYSLTVNNGHITFANTTSSMSAFMCQYLEKPLSGTYTISINVKAATKSLTLSYRDGGEMHDAMTFSTGLRHVTIQCTSLDCIRIGMSGSASVDIEWIKLEVGNISTDFSPRIYAEELALCQRYFTRLKTIYHMAMTQRYNEGQNSYMLIPLPVSLRSNPTVSYNNVQLLKGGTGGVWFMINNITCIGTSSSGVVIQLTGDEMFEANVPYFLIFPENGYMEFDAEIY